MKNILFFTLLVSAGLSFSQTKNRYEINKVGAVNLKDAANNDWKTDLHNL